MRLIGYSAFLFGVVLLINFSVAVPNPGHGISDFVNPGDNLCGGKVLKWVGLAASGHWECADLPSGGSGGSDWSSDTNGIYYSQSGKGVGIGSNLASINSDSILGVLATGKKYGIFAKAVQSDGNAIKAENYNGQHLGYLGARDYGVYGETSDASHSAIKGVNTNKNTEGILGGNLYGTWGKKGNYWGYLGGDYGVYGSNSNGNFGYLGGAYGAYGYGVGGYSGLKGENSNGNYGLLGSSLVGVYGKNSNGNFGYLGGSTYSGYFSGGDVYLNGIKIVKSAWPANALGIEDADYIQFNKESSEPVVCNVDHRGVVYYSSTPAPGHLYMCNENNVWVNLG